MDMKVSMNGLRTSLTHDTNTLGALLTELLADKDSHIKDVIREAFNDVASTIGTLNCVYNKNDADFIDMSEKLTVTRLADDIEYSLR